jgi:hypothetical protein
MAMSEEEGGDGNQTWSSEPIREVLVLEQFSGSQATFPDEEREISDLSELSSRQTAGLTRADPPRSASREQQSRCCLLL